MGAQPLVTLQVRKTAVAGDDAQTIIRRESSNEYVFAVVGHAGSGTSMIATTLEKRLSDERMGNEPFQVSILKARDVIAAWAQKRERQMPARDAKRSLADVRLLQDYGDDMREEKRQSGKADYSAVARGMVKLIQARRLQQVPPPEGGSGAQRVPDGKPRAYILDSIRHPAEVELLRYIYGDAFVLIGVVCEENKRNRRIQKKYDCSESEASAFMERDADDKKKHGQHVADAFHLSDFFVDNTIDRLLPNKDNNREWRASEDLSRLIKLIAGTEIIRPVLAETAMYHAFSSQLQSACLSRQVGAALVDSSGNVVATGTNEVPRAGGGVYGETLDSAEADGRCAYRLDGKTGKHICRNTSRQSEMVDEIVEKVLEQIQKNESGKLLSTETSKKEELKDVVRRTRVGSLLEFSRAVHAEMDALLSASRKGVSTVGCSLFVTTFPCHYCARHIVSAGIDEVQFIEPYPKSLAIDLHDDSIVVESSGWKPPSKSGTHVRFRPFSGVSPRLYKRAFFKHQELKNKKTGEMQIAPPEWASAWNLSMSSYLERESNITKDDSDE